MQAMAADCLQHWGAPDLVVANAGVAGGFETSDPADLAVMRRMLEINLLGVATTFQPFLQAMLDSQRPGALVGVASVAGWRGMPGNGAYCASKAAAICYCESLRGELQAQGIKVLTLAPGYIQTPLTQKNIFPMPFLMRAEDFASAAFKAIESGASFKVIPYPMAWVARILRILPDALFDRLFKTQPRKLRSSPLSLASQAFRLKRP